MTRPSACSSVPWVAVLRDADVREMLHRASSGQPHGRIARSALVVGANKGYLAAELLGAFHPWSSVSASLLLSVLNSQPGSAAWDVHKCGVCDDCRAEIPPLLSTGDRGASVDPGLPAWLAPRLSMSVYAVEPQPSNVRLLSAFAGAVHADAAATWPGWRADSGSGISTPRMYLSVLPVGLSNVSGVTGMFEERGAGDEGSSLGNAHRGSGELVPVPLTTVDELWAAVSGATDDLSEIDSEPPSAPPLDILTIDAEGHDPAVLDGAAHTLRRARLVRFEYHRLDLWAREASLQGTLSSLEALGFTCWLEWGSTLLQLSRGCWDSAYEFRNWANILCVHQGRAPAWYDALQAVAWTPDM